MTTKDRASQFSLFNSRPPGPPSRDIPPQIDSSRDPIPITYRDVMMDPVQARRLLESNTHNRPLNRRVLDLYTRIMSDGGWTLNGETIKISPTGRLLDGQHRLAAICKSGVNVPLTIAQGVPESAMVTVDEGKPRTGADALVLAGATNTHRMAAAISMIIRWETRDPSKDFKAPHIAGMNRRKVINREIVDYFLKNLQILGTPQQKSSLIFDLNHCLS